MAAESEQELVYVVSRSGNGGKHNVHTDLECHHVRRAKNVFEKPRNVIDEDRLCHSCAGDFSPGVNATSDTNATRKLLSAMSPEELGLSAIGERDGFGGDQA